MTDPVSGKTPVQNPLSPTSPCSMSQEQETIVQTGGDSTYEIKLSMESDLEAYQRGTKTHPPRNTRSKEKSLDFSEVEYTKKRPVQETVNPKNSITDTPEDWEQNSDKQFVDFSEGKPVQETGRPQ
ncbi:hypothetical protein OS493_034338, partial [Desmophyllum pertusum]